MSAVNSKTMTPVKERRSIVNFGKESFEKLLRSKKFAKKKKAKKELNVSKTVFCNENSYKLDRKCSVDQVGAQASQFLELSVSSQEIFWKTGHPKGRSLKRKTLFRPKYQQKLFAKTMANVYPKENLQFSDQKLNLYSTSSIFQSGPKDTLGNSQEKRPKGRTFNGKFLVKKEPPVDYKDNKTAFQKSAMLNLQNSKIFNVSSLNKTQRVGKFKADRKNLSIDLARGTELGSCTSPMVFEMISQCLNLKNAEMMNEHFFGPKNLSEIKFWILESLREKQKLQKVIKLLDEASGMPALKTQLHKNLQVQENLQGTEIFDTQISKKISFEDKDELIGISNVSYIGT
jgi:hypothetical protein